MLIYAALEDKIIARLKEASDSNALGYRLAEVASYAAQLQDEVFYTQVRKFPAVWVTIAGDRPIKPLSGRKSINRLTFAVMVATRNVRGERQTRHGTVAEPGTYQMLEDVRNLLARQAFGLAISPIRPGRVQTLYNTVHGKEARSVYSHEFETDYVYTAPDQDAGLPDLTMIGIDYFLQPDDGVKDAEDDMQLGAVG